MPQSMRPDWIASAVLAIVLRPVTQYEDIVCASMLSGSFSSKTISRAMLGFPGSGTTTP